MSIYRLSRLMLVIISALYPTLGYSQLPDSYQITLYPRFLRNGVLKPHKIYSNADRRSPQAAQKPSGAPTPSVPQRPKNETAGTRDVKTQRRQKPLRTSSTSSRAVANLELIKQQTLSTRKKYAKAADILAGKGILPAANFSFVDEWNQSHSWDDIGNTEYKLEERDTVSPIVPWPLKSYMNGGMNILYHGNLTIGSPAQSVAVEIDTGSADLWVSTARCMDCDSSKTPTSTSARKQYDSGSSSSYVDKRDAFHVGYGTGSVCGVLSSEMVEVNGLKVGAQDFGGVFKKTGVFKMTPTGGLLGLAFGTIATSKLPPFFENLLSLRKVRAPYFGVSLARGKNLGSELCIGCVNKARWRGNLEWIGVTKRSYWNLPLTGFRGTRDGPSASPPSGTITAAIDTGTSLIYFPSTVAALFYSTIPSAREATDIGPGLWAFPCDAAVNVSLGFGGTMFEISSPDFNLGRTKKGSAECVGAIIGIGNDSNFPNGLAIIGVTFLKNWYSVYDYSQGGRVGFGRSV